MDKLPHHCQENGFFFKQKDSMDLKMTLSGHKTCFKFDKVPDFYTIDEKNCYAAVINMEGLEVGSAAFATENILNIKFNETKGPQQIRNLNFYIPPEANIKKASVEVFNNDTIIIRAPLKK